MNETEPELYESKPWHAKAHRLIGEMCSAAYREANFRKGRKLKHHVPYHVPPLAGELVECLRNNDEPRAKAIFLRLAYSPEWANDPA